MQSSRIISYQFKTKIDMLVKLYEVELGILGALSEFEVLRALAEFTFLETFVHFKVLRALE